MSQSELNLGILAHVDAGKTTLTERLLYEAGVIDEIGSVDAGTTQTDSLELERRRGITIRAAVASFALEDVHVNLIDTPGHPDFIAEVERVLSVLDGVVLVISAVEGVQPQTCILMRALQRLSIPTLLFVNKIDRPGASDERVLQAISERLTPAIVPMGTVNGRGTPAADFTLSAAGDLEFRATLAEVLAERDDAIMAEYVEDESGVPYCRLHDELAAQTRQAVVHPVFFGSALTGAGVQSLTAGIAALLPVSKGDPDGPPAGTVFKIERGESGEKIAYVRMFSGTIRTRDRLQFGAGSEAKVTAIGVFERGAAVQRPSVSAGAVARLRGFHEIQIGDRIGEIGTDATRHQFPPPTLESVVVASDPAHRAKLRVALTRLAEQDPLIDVRQNDRRQELSVSLYGEVQQEVIQALLGSDYGIEVTFRELTPLCVERAIGTGEAAELLHAETNPFCATIGLRVDPAPVDSGIAFRLDVGVHSVPLYVYKRLDDFEESMNRHVCETLQEGLFGWQVTDCIVTMVECGYSSPATTAADLRKLTPLVLMQALERAGTVVCEPMVRVTLEIPAESIGAVTAALAHLGATIETQSVGGKLSTIAAVLPAARLGELQRQLSGLTSGEGVLESTFAGHASVKGDPPTRQRARANPLNRDEYLMHLARRVAG